MGASVRQQAPSPLGCTNAEVGPRPPGAAGRFGFLNGLCSLAGREGSEAKCKNLGTELKASHGFSQQEPGLSETHWMTSYLKKRFYHPRALFCVMIGQVWESHALRAVGVELRKKGKEELGSLLKTHRQLRPKLEARRAFQFLIWPLWRLSGSKQNSSCRSPGIPPSCAPSTYSGRGGEAVGVVNVE